LKQIDVPAAIHLTSDKLQARDLTLSLSVRPGRSDCRSNRRFIPRDAAGERGDETRAGALEPWGKSGLKPSPDHQVELGDDLACLDQGWYASFDRRDHMVSALVSKSRPIVMRRAIFLADGIR
jgi:hypothetical protein